MNSVGFKALLEALKQNPEIWDLFTGREEYSPGLRDRHGRFPHYLSRQGGCREARASKYLHENGFSPSYPDDRRFAVCLTHDIDCVYISKDCILDVLNNLAARPGLKKSFALRMPFYLLQQRSNPIWNFESIMELEREYGAKSTFFFMAGDRDLGRAVNYRIEDLKDDLRQISSSGWGIGLHCGYHSYDCLEELKAEKLRLEKALGQEIPGCRNHYLRFQVPDTWELLHQAGFKYDATLGYADFAGFRNGMCYPFKPFNLKTGRPIDIWEIPLAIMDGTLFDYMSLDAAGAWEIARQIIDTAESLGGVITILWHNTFMLGDKLKFYRKILDYCQEKNAWMTSCDDLFRWHVGTEAE
ncbi:MAG TPA: polysaccharide deacetylase family protein [Methanothrix sp.]|nr:polysaccharide deacetylase family protein [Methanothrix sp.]